MWSELIFKRSSWGFGGFCKSWSSFCAAWFS